MPLTHYMIEYNYVSEILQIINNSHLSNMIYKKVYR